MTPTPHIERALFACQQAFGVVDRDGRNEEAGYDFTRSDTMIREVRRVLLAHGVAARRTGFHLAQDGGSVVSSFVLSHPASGEILRYEAELLIEQEAGRARDKAVMAALTTTWCYWLRDLLMLERRDGIEVDTRIEARAERGRPPAPAPQTRRGPDRDEVFHGLPEQADQVRAIYEQHGLTFSVAAERRLLAVHRGKTLMVDLVEEMHRDCAAYKARTGSRGGRPRAGREHRRYAN